MLVTATRDAMNKIKMAFLVSMVLAIVPTTQGFGVEMYVFEPVCFENNTHATIVNSDPMTETNTTVVVFSVQSCTDVSFVLTNNETTQRPSIEILLQQRSEEIDSTIRTCHPNLICSFYWMKSTSDLQMCTDSQLFWISWNGNASIIFGHDEMVQDNIILYYENYLHFNNDFIGIMPVTKDTNWKFKIGPSTIRLKNEVRCNTSSESTSNINGDMMPVTTKTAYDINTTKYTMNGTDKTKNNSTIIGDMINVTVKTNYSNTNINGKLTTGTGETTYNNSTGNKDMMPVTEETVYNNTNNSTDRIMIATDETSTFDIQVTGETGFVTDEQDPYADNSNVFTTTRRTFTNEPTPPKENIFTVVSAAINDGSTILTDDKTSYIPGTDGLNHVPTMETIPTVVERRATSPTTQYMTVRPLSCFCECSGHTNPWAYLLNLNLTVEELRLEMKEHLQKLTKALSVNKKETTRYLTSKMSVRYERMSSQSIGLVGTISIALVPAIIVCTDVMNCARRARAIANLQNA